MLNKHFIHWRTNAIIHKTSRDYASPNSYRVPRREWSWCLNCLNKV